MKNMKYIAPRITETSIDLEGFICTSIVAATFFVEVDEYVNTPEEVLPMDGYDF